MSKVVRVLLDKTKAVNEWYFQFPRPCIQPHLGLSHPSGVRTSKENSYLKRRAWLCWGVTSRSLLFTRYSISVIIWHRHMNIIGSSKLQGPSGLVALTNWTNCSCLSLSFYIWHPSELLGQWVWVSQACYVWQSIASHLSRLVLVSSIKNYQPRKSFLHPFLCIILTLLALLK